MGSETHAEYMKRWHCTSTAKTARAPGRVRSEEYKGWLREYSKRPEVREANLERARKRHRANREAAIEMYGGECQCCGESTYEFLAIDHINGGGTRERKKRFPNSQSFYVWLKNNYDPATYRILCHNCNSAKGYYGFCPHDKEGK